MTPENRRDARQRLLQLTVLPTVVLAGLLALYGLALHNDHSDGHGPSVAALAAAGDRLSREAAPIAAAPPPDPSASNESSPGSDGEPVLVGCLALLGLLASLATGARAATRGTRPVFILRRVRDQGALPGRPTDPLCLHRLSVLRC